MSEEIVVKAQCGPVKGITAHQGNLVAFLGIPYAEPPLGERRFQPPVPKAPWTETFDASSFGPASAQVFDPKESKVLEFQDVATEADPLFVGVEDSLTLNVLTPAADDKRRPVVVYIHGGANWLESSRVSLYHMDSLALRGEVVTVSLNYRLGIFGALDLSVLGDGAPQGAHANCVRDQLCAIDWVKRNISFFGGDPDNITLVGESAGSMDISWMVSSGELTGRVKRLVMMSGVASVTGFGHNHRASVHSLDEGRERARAFLKDIGVSTFGDLTALSTEELMTRCAKKVHSSDILFDMDTLFYPRVDPSFVSQDPFIAATNGAADGFDILIGFTQYELGLWLTWDDELDRHSAEWAAKTCPFLPNELQKEMAALYRKELAHEPEGVQGMHLLSDAMFGAPSLIFADRVSRSNNRCWMYRFDYPCNDPRRGALHASDVTFFLGTWNSPAGRALLGAPESDDIRQERERLSNQMQDVLIAFAHTGSPATNAIPTWPSYSSEAQYFMSFERQCSVGQRPLGSRGDFWLKSIVSPVLP
ncbi:MAG: PnbA [Pseudomonadota bacterium]|jgi:para-nitrobenzyl esterase